MNPIQAKCGSMVRHLIRARFLGLPLLFAIGSGLSSCTTQAPRAAVEASAQKPSPFLPHSVRVLIASQERLATTAVVHREGNRQSNRQFARKGNQVVASNGDTGPYLHWTPIGPFQLADKTYLGSLEFRCHPEGGLQVFLHADLERYVQGVVAAELPLYSSIPAELQAQAIAVRTYTLATLAQRRGPEGFLWDGVQDQAFRGQFIPGASKGEQRAAVRLARAVEATRGLVLMEHGELLDVRFHAACGGTTADRSSLFPGTAPSPQVACAPCRARATEELTSGNPDKRRPLTWISTFPGTQVHGLAKQLGLGDRITLIQPMEIAAGDPQHADGSGRWKTVRLQGDKRAVSLPLDGLRKALGYGMWKSGHVVSMNPASGAPNGQGLTVRGLGRGHGVGLCQEGTHDYAAMGWTDFAILEHYYPGSQVVRLEYAPRP